MQQELCVSQLSAEFFYYQIKKHFYVKKLFLGKNFTHCTVYNVHTSGTLTKIKILYFKTDKDILNMPTDLSSGGLGLAFFFKNWQIK